MIIELNNESCWLNRMYPPKWCTWIGKVKVPRLCFCWAGIFAYSYHTYSGSYCSSGKFGISGDPLRASCDLSESPQTRFLLGWDGIRKWKCIGIRKWKSSDSVSGIRSEVEARPSNSTHQSSAPNVVWRVLLNIYVSIIHRVIFFGTSPIIVPLSD